MQRLPLVAAFAMVAFGAATTAAAQPAAQPAPSTNPCFRMSEIRNHTKGDNQTLYLAIRNSRDVFRLDMAGNCLAGASTNDPLVLEPVSGNDLICRPLDLSLKVHVGPGALSPCIIRQMTRLTPDEIAALPPKVRP